jgi:xylan 1,4-beta-xylosidase
LALRAAEEGMVLLKNDGLLPLQLPTNKKTNISMVGEWANVTTEMQGNYAGIARVLHGPYYSLSQLSNVNVIYNSNVGYINFPTTVSLPSPMKPFRAASEVAAGV